MVGVRFVRGFQSLAYRPCLPGSMFATVSTLTHTWEFLGDQFRVHVRPNRRTPKLCMAYSKGHWPRNIANFLRGQEISRKIKQTIKRSVYALHHLFSMPWAWLWCQRNIDTREKGAIFKPKHSLSIHKHRIRPFNTFEALACRIMAFLI